MVLFLWVTAALAASEPVSIPFSIETDSLCFFNADPELNDFGPLGHLGAKRGICQGIASVASGFLANATFDPAAPRPSEAEAKRLIGDVVRLHKGACPQRQVIPGYSDLRQFCADHRREFLRQAMLYNANLAMREILPTLPRFLAHKGVIKTQGDRREAGRALRRFHESLARGRAPTLMYYSHAVMVSAMRTEADHVELDVYDSNVPYLAQIRLELGSDGLPLLGERMVWDITPDRWDWRCR